MKKTKKFFKSWIVFTSFFIGILLILGLLFVLSLDNRIHVTLENNSTQDIKSVLITHEDVQDEVLLITGLKKGQVKQFSFLPIGDTSYSLTIEFANGKVISSGMYAGPGYKIHEFINDDEVNSDLVYIT